MCSRPTGADSVCRRRRRTVTGSPTTSPIWTRWRARWRRARRSTSPVTASAPTSRCSMPARGRRASRMSWRWTASACPSESPARAPKKMAGWLDALRDAPTFAPYRDWPRSPTACRRTNPRLARAKAEFLAPHWAQALPDGTARLRADPKHKLPFPTTTRMDDVYAVWRAITAPVLWVAAADSHIRRWLAADGDADAEVARRFAPHRERPAGHRCRCAGHMLHHDQPEAVARLLEAFLASPTRLDARAGSIRGAAPTSRSSVLTLIWGNNWIVMKFALQHAHPVVLNVQRTWLAVARAVRGADRAAAAAASRHRGSRSP